MLNKVDKIYVCHYTKLKERIPVLKKELNKHSISVEWVIKHDAENIDLDLLINEIPNVKSPLGLGGVHQNRTLRLSELSLILKHKESFLDIIKNNYKSALVLEDDVIFSDDFVNKFNNQIKNLEDDYDLVWVGTCCGLKFKKTVENNFLYKKEGSRCTHGYLISNKCAKKMIDFLKYNNYPMDFAFNKAIKELNLSNYWMEPALIYQNPKWDTSIQNDFNFI